MNSISLLKKETMSLKKANKDHKRSELIQSLNKEIADQDLIIETLRAMFPNQDTADKEIVKVLTKGPPKIRVETREELKIEIRKLKGQLTSLTNKKSESNNNNENSQKGGNGLTLDDQRNSIDTQQSVKTEFNENFFQQLDLLKKENEDLRLNFKAQQVIILRYEEETNETLQELNDLRLIKTDFQVLTKKYETLQKENEKIRETNNKKFVMTYNKEMRLEELEILNKTQLGKLNIVEKNVGFEMNNYKQKLEDLDLKNNELQADNDRMLIRFNELLEKNNSLNQTVKKNKEEYEAFKRDKEIIQNRNETMISNLRESLNQMEEEKNTFEHDFITVSNEMSLFKTEITKLNNENQEYRIQISELKEQLREALGRESDVFVPPIENTNISDIQTKNITQKPVVHTLNNEFLVENKFLKGKIKEFTIKQIELMEKIDTLELELRLGNKKESNISIKNKQYERQIQKIQNMQEKLKDMESNDFKKGAFQRLDSNLSHNSKNLEKEKIAKLDLDSNLSYSMSFSKINSKISSPIKSESLIETNSDITTENQELKKMLKQKQEEDLILKKKVESLEQETKGKSGKEIKRDLNQIENEKKIKELAEKISNFSLNNSDISKPGSILNSRVLDSNVSSLDSNIDSVMSYKYRGGEKIETDSNISTYPKKI